MKAVHREALQVEVSMVEREHTLNVALARVLRQLGFDARAEQAGTGLAGRIDILVRHSGARIAIKSEKGLSGASAVNDAKRSLERGAADAALALVYGEGQTADALSEDTVVEWAELPERDFQGLGHADLKWTSRSVRTLATVMNLKLCDLGRNVDVLSRYLQQELAKAADGLPSSDQDRLARLLNLPLAVGRGRKKKTPEHTRVLAARRGLLIIASAAMFHSRLVRHFPSEPPPGWNNESVSWWPLATIKQCIDSAKSDSVTLRGVLADEWEKILAVNYGPIFEAARAALVAMPPSPAFEEAVSAVARAGAHIAANTVALKHDLLGRVFHEALDSSQYDGSYYTSASAATLLAGLALRPQDIDDDLQRLAVIDPACGSGTLLMAACERVREIHEASTPTTAGQHITPNTPNNTTIQHVDTRDTPNDTTTQADTHGAPDDTTAQHGDTRDTPNNTTTQADTHGAPDDTTTQAGTRGAPDDTTAQHGDTRDTPNNTTTQADTHGARDDTTAQHGGTHGAPDDTTTQHGGTRDTPNNTTTQADTHGARDDTTAQHGGTRGALNNTTTQHTDIRDTPNNTATQADTRGAVDAAALIEDVVWGIDVNLTAMHMAATTLGMLFPATTFDKMNIHRAFLGLDAQGQARLGSLELLDEGTQERLPVVPAPTSAIRQAATEAELRLPGPEKTRVVIMNPPYTREGLRYDQFPTAVEQKLQQRQQELLGPTRAHSTSGTTGFLVLADHLASSDGDTVASVLPLTGATGASAEPVRRMLGENFWVELAVVSYDPQRINFSYNTTISEMLIVARRSNLPPAERAATRFVNLTENHLKPTDAARIAADLREGRTHTKDYVSMQWPASKMADGDWMPVRFCSPFLTNLYVQMLQGIAEPALEKLTRQASLKVSSQDINRTVDVSEGSDEAGRSALWSNNADREGSMLTSPDKYITRTGPRADKYWAARGGLMIPFRPRLNTNRVLALRCRPASVGYMWQNIHPHQHTLEEASIPREHWEKAMCVWLNSTLGIVSLIGATDNTELSWRRLTKTILETDMHLPLLTTAQASELAEVYDTHAQSELQPIAQAETDNTRLALDSAVIKTLKADREQTERARTELVIEPSITALRRRTHR